LANGLPLMGSEMHYYQRAKDQDELDRVNQMISFARENPHLAAEKHRQLHG